MTVICSTRHSSELFTWVPSSQRFVAEASDFTVGNYMSQVFDDACDEGFIIVSHRTGAEVLYVYDGRDEAGDETLGWKFKPFNRKTGRPVRLGEPGFGTSVYIFND